MFLTSALCFVALALLDKLNELVKKAPRNWLPPQQQARALVP